MNEEIKGGRRISLNHAYIFSAVIVTGYIVFYQFAPFDEPWNDIILNILTPIAAGFAAIMASLIFHHYEKDDAPRSIWQNLMIGCWLWFLAEVIWGYLIMVRGEVAVGIMDGVWVLGFIFFTLALYHQYSLIAPSKKNFHRNVAIVTWTIVLLIPLAIASLTNSLNIKTYVDFFYPFADLAVGIAGVLLIFAFQGGSLMRPWVGLVVFGITDFLYAWAEQTGLYAWSAESGNLLTLFIDTSYTAAYLILGLGFLSHWILIKYGIVDSFGHHD
jgi:hypothetical protein